MGTKQPGTFVLLYVGDGQIPESFTRIAAQRVGGMTIGNEAIDVTDKDGTRWRALLEGGGQALTLTCSGWVTDGAAFRLLTNLVTQGIARTWLIQFASGLAIRASCLIASDELNGEYTAAEQYTLSLESADDAVLIDDEESDVTSDVESEVISEGPHYELFASQAVNIAATSLRLASTTPATPGGTVVTINALAADLIVITKPSHAADPSLTWDAWSPYSANNLNPPGTGLTWMDVFSVSDESNAPIMVYGGHGLKVDAATALASVQPDFPIQLTGHTAYKFWHWDTPVSDNRGGISLRVETWRLVP